MRTKYDQTTRERVVRLFFGRRESAPQEAARASLRQVSKLAFGPGEA